MTAASNPSISDPKTETETRSCRVIFTCVKMKIATLPLVYKGATLFTPKKLGNLQESGLTLSSGNAKIAKTTAGFGIILGIKGWSCYGKRNRKSDCRVSAE
jgi:hypothetical protein